MILAERFWLTGIGGGGTGDSSCRRDLWRLLRAASSSWRARDEEEVVMAFEVGSMRMGSCVKVSESSMVARCR